MYYLSDIKLNTLVLLTYSKKKYVKKQLASFVLAIGLALGGCGGGSSSESKPAEAVPSTAPSTQNSPPVIRSPIQNELSIAENQTFVANVSAMDANGDDLTYWLSGPDAKLLLIANRGEFKFHIAPDFESPDDQDYDNIYIVTLNVSDGVEAVSMLVTISVTDQDESIFDRGSFDGVRIE